MVTERELQEAHDAASSALGKGWHELEMGRMSRAELGQLQRRLKRAETKLRHHRYAEVRS